MAKGKRSNSSYWRWWWFLVATLCLAACNQSPAATPTATAQRAIAPEFADFYEAHGGQALLGEPETGRLFNPGSGAVIQYFTHLRLDFDPALSTGEQVTVYPLGQWALPDYDNSAIILPEANSRQQLFPDSDFTVADPFLAFYEQIAGVDLLGAPISPRLWQGDVQMQYFENGRLEWHPALPEGERVQLGTLGQAHWLATQPAGFEVVFSPAPLAAIQTATIKAAVESPILYGGETQIIHAKALAEGQPVAGVVMAAAFTFAGKTELVDLGETGPDGALHAPLNGWAWQPGQWVELTISAYNGSDAPIGQTILRFRQW
ncbi:MAG: hypothetical protein KDE04_19260 [Anaerolineales bacterium]|nr:hypothetical protein [Anaerolineales bacterium]